MANENNIYNLTQKLAELHDLNIKTGKKYYSLFKKTENPKLLFKVDIQTGQLYLGFDRIPKSNIREYRMEKLERLERL
jgi:hypothetical protein